MQLADSFWKDEQMQTATTGAQIKQERPRPYIGSMSAIHVLQ